MAKAKPGTVIETGAKAVDILIGIENLNRLLRIKVHRAQRVGYGGGVEGSFQLLDAGDGTYS